jgi:hypothetical protein
MHDGEEHQVGGAAHRQAGDRDKRKSGRSRQATQGVLKGFHGAGSGGGGALHARHFRSAVLGKELAHWPAAPLQP